MNGGKDCEAGDERQATPVQVPIGWQRKADHGGGIVYLRYEKTIRETCDNVCICWTIQCLSAVPDHPISNSETLVVLLLHVSLFTCIRLKIFFTLLTALLKLVKTQSLMASSIAGETAVHVFY